MRQGRATGGGGGRVRTTVTEQQQQQKKIFTQEKKVNAWELGTKYSRNRELFLFSEWLRGVNTSVEGFHSHSHLLYVSVPFLLTVHPHALGPYLQTSSQHLVRSFLILALSLMETTVFYFERGDTGYPKEPPRTPNKLMSEHPVILINNLRLTVQHVEQTILNVIHFNSLLHDLQKDPSLMWCIHCFSDADWEVGMLTVGNAGMFCRNLSGIHHVMGKQQDGKA